jgi:hypothetical protein
VLLDADFSALATGNSRPLAADLPFLMALTLLRSSLTHAITNEASPPDVWPCVAQMGAGPTA